MGIPEELFINKVLDNYICSICSDVVKDMCQCISCDKLFCQGCIQSVLQRGKECPNCRQRFTRKEKIDKNIINIYNDYKIKCQKCQVIVKLEFYETHQNNNCSSVIIEQLNLKIKELEGQNLALQEQINQCFQGNFASQSGNEQNELGNMKQKIEQLEMQNKLLLQSIQNNRNISNKAQGNYQQIEEDLTQCLISQIDSKDKQVQDLKDKLNQCTCQFQKIQQRNRQNVLVTRGRLILQDSIYFGEIMENKPNGFGIIIYNSSGGSRNIGHFVNGKLNGLGCSINPNNQTFIGEIQDDYAQGWGIEFNNMREAYVGEWVQNVKEGKGYLIQKNGSKIEGIWKNNNGPYNP